MRLQDKGAHKEFTMHPKEPFEPEILKVKRKLKGFSTRNWFETFDV
jgi:hypothetical protein